MSDLRERADKLARELDMQVYWSITCENPYARQCVRAAAEMIRLLAAPSADADALRGALKALTDGMDRAGGDGYGMPECPWCRSQAADNQHDADCELVAARALLSTPDVTPAQGTPGG